MFPLFVSILVQLCYTQNNNYPAHSEINNEEWLDTDGNFIHAHDGSIREYNKIFYWIGGSQKIQFGSATYDWASQGINCYSSSNLMNWTFEGMIFKNTSLKIHSAPPPYKLNNPYILRNDKNNNFILWIRIDCLNDSLKSAAIAVSNTSICGNNNYKFINVFRPDGYPTGDLGIYKDIDKYNNGNNAYLIRNVANISRLGISKLNDDYTNTTGIISKGPHLEGLTLFKLKTYYVWGSQVTGWKPNANHICVTNNTNSLNNAIWNNCHNPTSSDTTYNSQDTTVVRFVDNINNIYTFMYMGDIWNYPNLTAATYIWLPLNFENNSAESFPHVTYYKTWHIGLHNVSIPE